jgi:hypothetical protein
VTEYSREDQDRGMLAVIMAAGNAGAASRQLAATGHKVPAQTLLSWRRRYHGRYSELETTYAPQIRDKVAAEYESFALAAADVARELLCRTQASISKMEVRDVPGALRNVATAQAIATDKAALLRGQPTMITETRTADQLIEVLGSKLGLR